MGSSETGCVKVLNLHTNFVQSENGRTLLVRIGELVGEGIILHGETWGGDRLGKNAELSIPDFAGEPYFLGNFQKCFFSMRALFPFIFRKF